MYSLCQKKRETISNEATEMASLKRTIADPGGRLFNVTFAVLVLCVCAKHAKTVPHENFEKHTTHECIRREKVRERRKERERERD